MDYQIPKIHSFTYLSVFYGYFIFHSLSRNLCSFRIFDSSTNRNGLKHSKPIRERAEKKKTKFHWDFHFDWFFSFSFFSCGWKKSLWIKILIFKWFFHIICINQIGCSHENCFAQQKNNPAHIGFFFAEFKHSIWILTFISTKNFPCTDVGICMMWNYAKYVKEHTLIAYYIYVVHQTWYRMSKNGFFSTNLNIFKYHDFYLKINNEMWLLLCNSKANCENSRHKE